jgi:hypothetical protein
MATQLSFKLGGSMREWLILRGHGNNPFSAAGGPLPQITVPLEARVTERDIDVQMLRLAFDLKIRNLVIGQGEVGPYMYLRADDQYIPATATCPQAALPYLINPEPSQGRITLTLAFRGLLRYRHNYQQGDNRAQSLGEPDTWHIESIGDQTAMDLDVQVARSDWYEQVVERLGIGSYLLTPLHLPYGLKAWQAALGHLDAAGRALTQADPPAVFGYCRAALDALPGAKTKIFEAMPEGKKREAIDELTKQVGVYLHSGRHVEPNTDGQQAGDFPVDRRDAQFVYNMTKLLLSQIYSLVFAP